MESYDGAGGTTSRAGSESQHGAAERNQRFLASMLFSRHPPQPESSVRGTQEGGPESRAGRRRAGRRKGWGRAGHALKARQGGYRAAGALYSSPSGSSESDRGRKAAGGGARCSRALGDRVAFCQLDEPRRSNGRAPGRRSGSSAGNKQDTPTCLRGSRSAERGRRARVEATTGSVPPSNALSLPSQGTKGGLTELVRTRQRSRSCSSSRPAPQTPSCTTSPISRPRSPRTRRSTCAQSPRASSTSRSANRAQTSTTRVESALCPPPRLRPYSFAPPQS